MEVATCRAEGCENETEMGTGIWATRRLFYCSKKCGKKTRRNRRTRKNAEAQDRRRNATWGRICEDCNVDDSEARWSSNVRFCSNCERQRCRRGRCDCGQLLRTARGQPVSVGLFCRFCSANDLRKLKYVPITLLSPKDDRERLIWRSQSYGAILRHGLLQSVMIATEKQWRTWR